MYFYQFNPTTEVHSHIRPQSGNRVYISTTARAQLAKHTSLSLKKLAEFAAIWVAQLITPTIIFLLTLARAVNLRRHGAIRGGIIGLMLRDGE